MKGSGLCLGSSGGWQGSGLDAAQHVCWRRDLDTSLAGLRPCTASASAWTQGAAGVQFLFLLDGRSHGPDCSVALAVAWGFPTLVSIPGCGGTYTTDVSLRRFTGRLDVRELCCSRGLEDGSSQALYPVLRPCASGDVPRVLCCVELRFAESHRVKHLA